MASFKKLKSGWQYRISYKKEDGSYATKNGNGYKTKAEAKLAAEETERNLKASRRAETPVSDTPFAKYYEDWAYLYKIGKQSKATDDNYRTAISVVKEYFPNVKLGELTPELYQAFLNDYAARGVARSTVKKMNSHVGACLKRAFKFRHIPIDVTYGVSYSGNAGKAIEEKYLHGDEAQQLLQALLKGIKTDYTTRYMAILQLATGARIGEIMALTFDAFDFKKNTVRIDKSWDYKYTNAFKNTKNGIHRTIPVDTATMDLMKPFVAEIRKRSLASMKQNKHNLVFVKEDMSLPTVEAVNEMLERTCSRIRLNKITSHALRHTHVSLLLSQGLDVFYIAERIGDTPDTVTKTYAHVLKELRTKGTAHSNAIMEQLYQTSAK